MKDCNIVAQVINVDSAQLMGKIVRHVAKRITLPRNVSLGKAKAKALVVLSIKGLNTDK